MRPPTLTEALTRAGYTHYATMNGQHAIVDRTGMLAFAGRAHEVWAWLHEQRVSDELAEINRDAEVVAENVARRA